MTTWHEYVQRNASVPEWPYPIRYGKVNEITSDVLILGGGVAGCHAAISAAKNGAKTVVRMRYEGAVICTRKLICYNIRTIAQKLVLLPRPNIVDSMFVQHIALPECTLGTSSALVRPVDP